MEKGSAPRAKKRETFLTTSLPPPLWGSHNPNMADNHRRRPEKTTNLLLWTICKYWWLAQVYFYIWTHFFDLITLHLYLIMFNIIIKIIYIGKFHGEILIMHGETQVIRLKKGTFDLNPEILGGTIDSNSKIWGDTWRFAPVNCAPSNSCVPPPMGAVCVRLKNRFF